MINSLPRFMANGFARMGFPLLEESTGAYLVVRERIDHLFAQYRPKAPEHEGCGWLRQPMQAPQPLP